MIAKVARCNWRDVVEEIAQLEHPDSAPRRRGIVEALVCTVATNAVHDGADVALARLEARLARARDRRAARAVAWLKRRAERARDFDSESAAV